MLTKFVKPSECKSTERVELPQPIIRIFAVFYRLYLVKVCLN